MLRARWGQDGAQRARGLQRRRPQPRPGRGQALLALHVDGQLLVRYASDGVIAATPAGSTAYSYAAGGPIVSPQTRAMIVTPDAPHGLFNRAVVLGAEESLGVEVLPNSAPVAVEVDGQLLVRGRPGLDARDHPEPVAGARRAARLGGLRRARAAQARHHRPRRAGQLRLRRPRALGEGATAGGRCAGASARAARGARGRRCGRRCRRPRPRPTRAASACSRSSASSAISKTPSSSGGPTSAPGSAAASCSRACASRGEPRAGAASRRPVVVPLRQSCPMTEHDRVAVVTGAGSGHRARGRARAAGRRLRAWRWPGGARRRCARRSRRATPRRPRARRADRRRRPDAVAALFARVRDALGPRRPAVQQRRLVRPPGAVRGPGLRGLAGGRRRRTSPARSSARRRPIGR